MDVLAPWPFSLSDPLSVDGRPVGAAAVVAALGPTLTVERRQRINDVVAARTFAVAPILEQVADAGNIAAVLRSAEGLGYGGVHLVPAPAGGRERTPNRVTQGADKWLLTRTWDSSSACMAGLRAAGYRIAATVPGGRSIALADLDLGTPVAVAFGNEHRGVSELLAAEADELVTVPMHGFSRSFNVSVAAAVVLAHLRDRLPREARRWQPTAAQRLLLTAHYYLASQPHAASLLRHGGALDREPPPGAPASIEA
jgi:tRNA (guanosine-2'-O-)-methyltransferase